jgi:hypothetical protein
MAVSEEPRPSGKQTRQEWVAPKKKNRKVIKKIKKNKNKKIEGDPNKS